MIDVARRGGTIAVDLWSRNEAWAPNDQLKGFLSFSGEFAEMKKINKVSSHGKRVVPVTLGSTELKVEEVGDTPKYKRPGIGKTKAACVDAHQFETRWPDTAPEMVIRGTLGKGTGEIHFHLDGTGNICELVEERGSDTDEGVTTRELRYLRRYWGRKEVPDRGVSCNGYTSRCEAVIVKCPWY